MRRLAPACAALLCACASPTTFTPASFIEKLRVLDIKATPAEVVPGEQTLLQSLVVDPYKDVRPLSYLWVMCDPDPSGSSASPCGATSDLRSISDLTGGAGGALPAGVHIFPFGSAVYDTAPADAFDPFPPGSPERENGLESTILLVTWEGTDPQELRSSDTVEQVALKRVRIVLPGAARNHNPVLAEVRVGGHPFTDVAPPRLQGGSTIVLSATAGPGSAERYDRTLPDGTVLHETEPMVFSWYANAGAFDEVQQESARTSDGQGIDFRVPTYDQTAGGVVDLWVVLRDSRGGSDFAHRQLVVAP